MRTELLHAFRHWTKRPALALTAITTLALGIGTTTAMFSVADAVLLRPLPWREPGRLVAVWVVRPPVQTNPVLSAMWDRFPVSWAVGAGQLLRSHVYGVEPTAPHVFVVAVAALSTVAVMATCVPALQASRVDPAETLRAE